MYCYCTVVALLWTKIPSGNLRNYCDRFADSAEAAEGFAFKSCRSRLVMPMFVRVGLRRCGTMPPPCGCRSWLSFLIKFAGCGAFGRIFKCYLEATFVQSRCALLASLAMCAPLQKVLNIIAGFVASGAQSGEAGCTSGAQNACKLSRLAAESRKNNVLDASRSR